MSTSATREIARPSRRRSAIDPGGGRVPLPEPGTLNRPSPLKFRPVLGSRPKTEIIAQVRAMLGHRKLRPGDRLPTERELALQFQVSRNSVRQALHALQEQGLVDIRQGPAGGASIQVNGGDAIETAVSDLFLLGAIRPQDLTEIRIVIGVEVVRLACLRGSAEAIDGLERNVAAAEQAVREGDLARRTELNLAFHRLLARMTDNALLVAVTAAIITITGQFVSRLPRTPSREVMPFRRRLLKHLRARDVDAATDAMRRHLQRQQALYLKALARLDAPAGSGLDGALE